MSYKSLILGGVVIIGGLFSISHTEAACFFNGLSLSNGQTVTGYKYNTVSSASGSLCTTPLSGYEVFQCLSNGNLNGLNGNNLGAQHYSTYPYLSCSVQAPLDCNFGASFGQQKTIKHTPDGFFSFLPDPIGHGLWHLGYLTITGYTRDDYLVTAYQLEIVDDSADCDIPNIQYTGSISSGSFTVVTGANTTMVYCKNGQIYDLYTSLTNNTGTLLDTNAYKYSSCQKRPPRDCRLGNTIIPHGSSITTYNTNDAQGGNACASQVRSCNDGTLAGSFIYETCSTYYGACGAASGMYLAESPEYNLCAGGTASTPTRSSTTKSWSRECVGNGGGTSTTVSCKAYQTGATSEGACITYPYGASTLSANGPGLCRIGVAQMFTTTSYGWTRRCHTDVGNNYCEAKRGETPTATITYSTTSLTNGPVFAYLSNITPYDAIVYNNNGNASRTFNTNGSFVFALKFGEKISYLTATVSWINQGPRTLADLVRSYTNSILPDYRDIIWPQSTRYNLIDIQTMTNLGILKPTGSKRSPILDMNKKLSRGEFIQSIYTLMQTIHSYSDLPTKRPNGYTYKGAGITTKTRYQLGRATALDLRDHIKHKQSKKVISIDRNTAITPKEVNDTITALLHMHEDNTALWARVWSETIEKKQTSLTRSEYASMLRRMLESYDGIPIGNNPLLIRKIYDRIRNKSIADQQKELSIIMQTIRASDPVAMAKLGVSLGHLLIDLDAVVNNTIPKRKGRTILSIDQVQQKNRATDQVDTIFDAPYDRRQDFLLSPY